MASRFISKKQTGIPVERSTRCSFAVGWPANLEKLGLAEAGIAADAGRIPVNDWLQTNVRHVFAAGDVNGRSMLVPSARHEGRLAAENAVIGTRRRVAHDIVPTGSFTDPEYASVGLTEAQACDRYDCAVAMVRHGNLLRAVIDGHVEGFCKLIVERRHRFILGAQVLGEYSAEVVQVAAVAMTANLRVEQLAELQARLPHVLRGAGHGRPTAGPRATGIARTASIVEQTRAAFSHSSSPFVRRASSSNQTPRAGADDDLSKNQD